MPDCNDESCDCHPQILRRDFLKLAGITSLGAILTRSQVFAGPFTTHDFESEDAPGEVPADKKLSPAWRKSLFERGAPREYRGKTLMNVGMPVGGICAGMVYLRGDGKLWHWDIFNQNKLGVRVGQVSYKGRQLGPIEGSAYVSPPEPQSELEQGFSIRIDGKEYALDATEWDDVRFVGQYPIGHVSYQDHSTKVKVHLEAFSPFIPLNEDDSGLPVTLMNYRVENHEAHSVTVELSGHLKNPIGLHTTSPDEIETSTDIHTNENLSLVVLRAHPRTNRPSRPEVDVETWNHGTYEGWTVTGTAFGAGPILKKNIPDYQGDVGGPSERVVNSHATAPAGDITGRDAATGKMVGRMFTITREHLNFWIGGGNHPGQTCLNLVVDDKIVRTATGHDNNRMRLETFPVKEFFGKSAHLEIVDEATGPWGNIGVGRIWLADQAPNEFVLEQRADYGTMALAAFAEATIRGEDKTSTLTVVRTLSPGESCEVTFAIAWHFPNLRLEIPDDKSRRYYATKFADAGAVVNYVNEHRERLIHQTRLWTHTWYDSTLPYWFLDRTFANTSTLATTTAHRFGTGRFYAWEGVGCCQGTCTHVWHYAQAVGRIFPALERDTRERVDYGIGFHPDTGAIGFRAEFDTRPAVDGQAGTILRTYREHLTSVDSAFLTRVWPRAKKAMEYLIGVDPHQEGVLWGPQENTLDAAWFGKIAWTSSLYNAALRASAEMAEEMHDSSFAKQCRDLATKGTHAIQNQLFNGEYFTQTRDPQHENALGTYKACHIDQVMGQMWAWQLGLGRVLDKSKTVSALKALYKYNFTPDVGPFRETHPEGRWYAMPGNGGMIMTTNPHHNAMPYGDAKAWQFGYFNECMSGFEHQVASHMIAEGLVEEGLTVTRAIHDRYDASLRNPYNEVECSDHYARAMASYGSFVSICGFHFHGPKAVIGFAPRLAPEHFKSAFTAAEGWGTFEQRQDKHRLSASIHLLWGKLRIQTIHLASFDGQSSVSVRHGNKIDHATLTRTDNVAVVTLEVAVSLSSGESLEISIIKA